MTNEEKKQKAESLIKELSLILEISEQDIFNAIYRLQESKLKPKIINFIDYIQEKVNQGIIMPEAIQMFKEEIKKQQTPPL